MHKTLTKKNNTVALLSCRGIYLDFLHGLAPLVSLKQNVTANQYKVLQTDHLIPIMKYFSLAGYGFFQDDPTPRVRGLTEWFHEDDNNLNCMFRAPQVADLNPVDHLWEILEQSLK